MEYVSKKTQVSPLFQNFDNLTLRNGLDSNNRISFSPLLFS